MHLSAGHWNQNSSFHHPHQQACASISRSADKTLFLNSCSCLQQLTKSFLHLLCLGLQWNTIKTRSLAASGDKS